MRLHTLTEFGCARVPEKPGVVFLSLQGDDGSDDRYAVTLDTAERIVAALDAELKRMRAERQH